MTRIIALDFDGVLLDFNLAYAKVWSRFAGRRGVPAAGDYLLAKMTRSCTLIA